MSIGRRLLLSTLLLFLPAMLLTLSKPASGPRMSPGNGALRAEVSEVSDEEKILAVLERFVASWNANDAEQAVKVYTDPHFDVNATPQEESREATIEKYRRYYDEFDTTISVSSDDIIVFGNYAVQRGEYILTSTHRAGGETEALTRRYVEVLRKDESGDWFVHWGIDAALAPELPADAGE